MFLFFMRIVHESYVFLTFSSYSIVAFIAGSDADD